jgi:hypothetical protein
MNAKFCYARSQSCEKRQLASSCLTVRMEQPGSQSIDCVKFDASVFSKNLSRKFKFH